MEAWNTLLLLLDAHQLAAQSNYGEAVRLSLLNLNPKRCMVELNLMQGQQCEAL